MKKISGYLFGRRKEFNSIDEAWSYGSQFVCISTISPFKYENISTEKRLNKWLNDGIAAGLFIPESSCNCHSAK